MENELQSIISMKRIISIIAFLVFFTTGVHAQILGATDNSTTLRKNDYLYKPVGHYLRLETGLPFFVDVIDASYGYQISPYILVGIGAGAGSAYYHYHKLGYKGSILEEYDDIGFGIPIYGEVILSTPKHKWALFADMKIGTLIPIYDKVHYYYNGNPYTAQFVISSLYIKSIVGFRFRNFGLGAGMVLMGKWQFQTQISYNIPLKVHE